MRRPFTQYFLGFRRRTSSNSAIALHENGPVMHKNQAQIQMEAQAQHLPIDDILRDVYDKVVVVQEGELANYIPELSKVDPQSYGMAVAATDGRIHTVGDAELPFTIQSTSKALTYCMALELVGREEGSITCRGRAERRSVQRDRIRSVRCRPYNPMVNAGAITVAGILRDALGPEKAFDAILSRFSEAAGRQLHLNESVYRSEAATGAPKSRDRSPLAERWSTFGTVESALDLYFKQCSIVVTAKDLAMIGATMANMGEQPVTGKQFSIFQRYAIRRR